MLLTSNINLFNLKQPHNLQLKQSYKSKLVLIILTMIKIGGIIIQDLKIHMLANIKREITKVYKESFGKGPEKTEVDIYEKFVVLKISGALSQIEETLMNTIEGIHIVERIRNELVLAQTELYIPAVEKIVNEKIYKITYLMDNIDNTMYIFLLFENEIKTVKESVII